MNGNHLLPAEETQSHHLLTRLWTQSFFRRLYPSQLSSFSLRVHQRESLRHYIWNCG